MIEPVKMKPQNSTNFKGMNAVQDPLDPRSSYRNINNENKGILAAEGIKIQNHDVSKNGGIMDLKG